MKGTGLESEGNYIVRHPEEKAGASGPWLAARLKHEGLVVHPQSGIAESLITLQQLRELILSKRSTGSRSFEEHFRFFSESYGTDFLTKALHWGYDSGLRLSREQWKQITSGNPNIATSGQSSVDRNKTWEIVIGSLARTFCSRVDFEEPDLICQFANKKIAIAAKVIYSEEKMFNNVKKGLQQANVSGLSKNIDAYLIFVNVVNIYPFFDVFKRTVMSSNNSDDVKNLQREVIEWCNSLPLIKMASRLKKETNKPIGVGFFIPFILAQNGNPLPFFYLHMPLTWSVESDEYRFSQKFLQACNIVLGYPHETPVSGDL